MELDGGGRSYDYLRAFVKISLNSPRNCCVLPIHEHFPTSARVSADARVAVMLDNIRGFAKTSNLKPTTTIERTLLEQAPAPAPAETRWVKGADGKWREEPVAASGGPAVPAAMRANPWEMHGQCYGHETERNGWAAPLTTYRSDAPARPGYDSMDASEYADEPEVLNAKVKHLARLVLESNCCVAYAGAGLSTAAGIDDYASRSGGSGAAEDGERLLSPMCAQPTLAHRVIAGLHRAGHLHRLLQQNHGEPPKPTPPPPSAASPLPLAPPTHGLRGGASL